MQTPRYVSAMTVGSDVCFRPRVLLNDTPTYIHSFAFCRVIIKMSQPKTPEVTYTSGLGERSLNWHAPTFLYCLLLCTQQDVLGRIGRSYVSFRSGRTWHRDMAKCFWYWPSSELSEMSQPRLRRKWRLLPIWERRVFDWHVRTLLTSSCSWTLWDVENMIGGSDVFFRSGRSSHLIYMFAHC